MRIDKQQKDVSRLKCNTINLHEELAEVEYIFCDKTGTLTQNELVYNSISILDPDAEDGTHTFQTSTRDALKLSAELKEYENEEIYQHFFNCINLCQDCLAVDKGKTVAYQG